MIVPELEELKIMSVLDRGVPNKECVAIQVRRPCNMGQFGLMVGVYNDAGTAVPVNNYFFWFGDGLVNEDDWIFLYTGSGEWRTDNKIDGNGIIYTAHWGNQVTLFANTSVVPILFQIGTINVESPPLNLPQSR